MAEQHKSWIGVVVGLAVALILFELWKNGSISKIIGGFTGAANTAKATTTGASTTTSTSGTSTHTSASASSGTSAATTSHTSTSIAKRSVYTVASGETLSGIATAHGISLASLEQANPHLSNPNQIKTGQTIYLPWDATHKVAAHNTTGTSGHTATSSAKTAKATTTTTSGSHTSGGVTVQSGDTLSGIAAAHGLSLAELEAANPQISHPSLIYVGQHVNIPSSHTSNTTHASTTTAYHYSGQPVVVKTATKIPSNKSVVSTPYRQPTNPYQHFTHYVAPTKTKASTQVASYSGLSGSALSAYHHLLAAHMQLTSGVGY